MRRILSLWLAAALGVLAAGCGGATASTSVTQAPATVTQAAASPTQVSPLTAGPAGPAQAGGTATATVTVGATKVTITGGRCLDGGAQGVDVAVGDWSTGSQNDQLRLLVYHESGKTPTASGWAGGTGFVLGSDATATIAADMTGTFAGTDSIGSTHVEGTFSCQ